MLWELCALWGASVAWEVVTRKMDGARTSKVAGALPPGVYGARDMDWVMSDDNRKSCGCARRKAGRGVTDACGACGACQGAGDAEKIRRGWAGKGRLWMADDDCALRAS